MPRIPRLLLLASVAALPVGLAAAASSDQVGIWSLQGENSSISSAKVTDRYYTNGIHVGWTSGEGAAPVAAGLGRPRVYPVVEPGDLAGRSEHDAFVVELGGDQPPAGVLLTHEHLGRHPDVVVVRRIGVVSAVGKNDRRP